MVGWKMLKYYQFVSVGNEEVVRTMQVSGNFGLGSVSVGKKLFLVVEKFFASLGRVFLVLCWKATDQPTIQLCLMTRKGYVLSTIASTGQASWQKPQ